MKYKKLRTQILLMVMSLSIISMTFIQVYYYQDRQNLLYEISTEKLLMLTKMIRKFDKKRLKRYRAYHSYFTTHKDLVETLHEKSPPRVDRVLGELYSFMKNADNEFEHLHLYDAFGTTLAVASEGDHLSHMHFSVLTNPVLAEAIKTGNLVTGYMPADTEGYYYSIVAPLMGEGVILGYIEFGINAGSIVDQATQSGHYLYALYHNDDKEGRKMLGTREIGRIVSTNSPVFEHLQMDQKFIYEYANLNRLFAFEGRHYLLHQFDIETPFQKNFAQMLLVSDVTEYVHSVQRIMISLLLISGFILALIFAILLVFVNKLVNRLLSDEMELEAQRDQIHAVMDHSDSLIVLFLREKLVLANRPFLHFFNCDTINAFVAHCELMPECFEPEHGVFTCNDASPMAWIEILLSTDVKQRVVSMRHVKSGELRYFSVRITAIDQQHHGYVVAFSDITSLFEEAQTDRYKARHDNLTEIYNRHYFNELLLLEMQKAQKQSYPMALLMIDLDHFKRVNDTYGHAVGDHVLKRFVEIISNNIRGNDIFARWGGEEFVVLLTGTSQKTALRVAEHLRESIEIAQFATIGSITCSIGVSEYLLGDSPSEWMSRADMALYNAKDLGRNRVELL